MTRLPQPPFWPPSCSLPCPQAGRDITDMSDAERAAFRAEVRAYLLENPEVLMEAIAVLEDRQAAEESARDMQLVARLCRRVLHVAL